MSGSFRVLGVDLASKSWTGTGSAVLTFKSSPQPRWLSVEYGCIHWPNYALTPAAMAEVIHSYFVENRIDAISLDGPQGWREPNPGDRKGVGRWCEYLAGCQGKAGGYGKTYPGTYCGWIRFCLDVFETLRERGDAHLVNNADEEILEPLGDHSYWLLECYPTSIWKTSGLKALPGKEKIARNLQKVSSYASSLKRCYGLPNLWDWQGTHDDLQAVVAALPAAGLLGGPCRAVPKGKPGWFVDAKAGIPRHWVEGIIWDSEPLSSPSTYPVEFAEDMGDELISDEENIFEREILLHDCDDSVEIVHRGVRLFRQLVDWANDGESIGVGYAQFACIVCGVKEFKEITGRHYAPSDTAKFLCLANQITKNSGGRLLVSKNGKEIDAGMDTFIWSQKWPHERAPQAFSDTPYTEEEWNMVFPGERRRLLRSVEF